MATSHGSAKEGYELHLGTNYIEHAVLTKLLLPILLSIADARESDIRIINVSAEGHFLSPSAGILFNKSKLDALGIWAHYGQSKLPNIFFTRELALRCPTITSVAVHPGMIKRRLYRPSQ